MLPLVLTLAPIGTGLIGKQYTWAGGRLELDELENAFVSYFHRLDEYSQPHCCTVMRKFYLFVFCSRGVSIIIVQRDNVGEAASLKI